MNQYFDFQQWQKYAIAQTEILLERVLPTHAVLPNTLHDAMRYSTLGGGKRLRALLVLAASQLGECVQEACEAAMVAVECIHAYSLVHDDMPIMDNDQLRRGKATCHIRYGEAMALLTGDALQTLAFNQLSQPTALDAQQQLTMLSVLTHATGSLGMAGGQAIDLENIGHQLNQHELEQMHSLKTGALIRACVQLGALSCHHIHTNTLEKLDNYAQKLGLAFQVIDDILDCEADSVTLGKTAGKDAQADKPTYVQLMGLDSARNYANQLINDALIQIQNFDYRANYLRNLAQLVIHREY